MAAQPGDLAAAQARHPLPCATCHSECCGPVPVSRRELDAVIDALCDLPPEYLDRLKVMQRQPFECSLLDNEQWRCPIWEKRPAPCRLFGYVPKMQCPHQHLGRVVSKQAERRAMMAAFPPARILASFDLTWPELDAMIDRRRTEREMHRAGEYHGQRVPDPHEPGP